MASKLPSKLAAFVKFSPPPTFQYLYSIIKRILGLRGGGAFMTHAFSLQDKLNTKQTSHALCLLSPIPHLLACMLASDLRVHLER